MSDLDFRPNLKELEPVSRKAIPDLTTTIVLTKCGRRCALCFGFSGDLGQKKGQIAHIDRDPANAAEANLVFLCLEHHDEYDSKTSQSKGVTAGEILEYRKRLHRAVETGLAPTLRVEADLREARASERSKEAAILEHDTGLFHRADTILAERDLVALLDDLQTNDAHSHSAMRRLERFGEFFRETGNHYIAGTIATPAKKLLNALGDLRHFTAINFFTFPKPSSIDEDWRYAMHPRLNVDREGLGNIEGTSAYDRHQVQLDELCEQVRASYKAYRRAITLTVLR